jgi:AraC family transcriptional regulator of arabinose operon
MLTDTLEYLLRNAVLDIIEFDIHYRSDMKTFNRTQPYYVMSYHKKGNAKLRVGSEIYSITPGTVALIPPNIEHDHYKDSEEETVFLWWHFTYEIAKVIDVLKAFQFPITFKLQNTEEFEKVFLQFMNSTTQPGYLPTTILKKAKALELIYLLFDSAMKSEETSPVTLQAQSFLGILAQIIQYPERETSLLKLSKQLHMHPTYISNRFKELFGRSPIQVQREMRIHRAKTLLKTSEMSITEISQEVGFSGITNFTRLFKAYVGISPSRFREIQQKYQENA